MVRNVAIIYCVQYSLNFLGYVTFICYCSMKARAHVREFSQTSRSADGNRVVDCAWNVMAHAQKPDFVFRRKGRVHLNRQGPQFSRLLAAEVCTSAVVMLDKPYSEIVWRVLATHFIRQFPLHLSSRASPCAVTFQLDSVNIAFVMVNTSLHGYNSFALLL